MSGKERTKLLPQCRVVHQNKIAGIEIDGVNHGVINGYVAYGEARQRSEKEVERIDFKIPGGGGTFGCGYDETTIREMYRSGVRIYELDFVTNLYWRDGDYFDFVSLERDLSELIAYIRKYAPECYFTIRWGLFVPEWWGRVYPDELVQYYDGSKKTWSGEHASYASLTWRKRAGEILEEALKTIIGSELVHYFAGIHLAYGNCGEWNNFGYHERNFPDYSDCMKKAYGEWGGKELPTPEERLKNRHRTLRDLPEEKNTVSYYQFWQEFTVDTILYFAHIVRTVTGGRSLVGTFYGYYIGHLYHFTGPYHFQDSGHYAVSRLIESPDIDYLAGPYAYDERLVCDVPQSAYSSIQLHGKLWYSENDQRTHRLKSGDMFGETKDLAETLAVTKRNFASNLTKGCAYYFFDFVLGWYRDPEFYSIIRRCKGVENFLRERQISPSPEVAVFFSEETIPYMGNGKNEVTVALARMMRRELDMAGAPYALYTMKDIAAADLSGCKIVIFLNAYYIPEAQRKAIEEKVFCDNRTVVFLHSAACVNEMGINVQQASEWMGIHFEEMENMTTDRVNLCDNPDIWHKLTGFLNTTYVVKDEDTIPLAQYTHTQFVAAAEKRKEDHRVIYWAMPSLNEEELQILYARSGVHLYTPAGTVVHAMGQFACLYSRQQQNITLRFPCAGQVIFDLMTGEVLARDTDAIDIGFGPDADSRLIYAGTVADWEYYVLNILN